MTDLQTARDNYKFVTLNDVALVKSEHNIADALTKVKTCSMLMGTIFQGKIKHPVEQWISRTKRPEKYGLEKW